MAADSALHEREQGGEFPLAWQTLDRPIGQIYECALDPLQWNATIEESGSHYARPNGKPPS